MKNLLLIGYCYLDDGFLYAAKALEKYNYKIFFFPYLSYDMDNVKEKDQILIELIKKEDINICLWWNNSIKFKSMNEIYEKTISKHILFNWDPFLYNYEKYNALCWQDRINEKKMIYPLMDHVFSCFEVEIKFFDNNKISYLPPGFDKEISFYDYDEMYECDISIVCTNLYNYDAEFPEDSTNISRYEIVNKLYENRDKIKFHFYGPENFKNIFPDCYKGFIKYKDCYKVFSNSKINLSIHPLILELNSENSKAEYFSERVPQILGCRGLLMTNSHLSNVLKADIDYIYVDRANDWYDKVLDIIQNTDKYDHVREAGYEKAINNYQWDDWAKIIYQNN